MQNPNTGFFSFDALLGWWPSRLFRHHWQCRLLLLGLLSLGSVWAEPGVMPIADSGVSNINDIKNNNSSDTEVRLLDQIQVADFHFLRDEHSLALHHNDEAMALNQRFNIPEYSWQLYEQRAKILSRMGKESQSMAFRRFAIEQISRIQVHRPQINESLLTEFQTTRVNYIKQLLALGDKQAALSEILDIWEGLKQGQLNEYLAGSCIIPNQQIRQLLKQHQDIAIIYPIAFDNRIEILVVIGDHIQRIKISQSYARITRLTHRLNLAISGLRPEYVRYAKSLYAGLIKPMEKVLESSSISTIVWVQDQSLLGLPVAALQNAQGRFLIEDYALAITPGLDLLSSDLRKQRMEKLFLVGTQQASHYQQQTFPALPAVAEELSGLSQLFEQQQLNRGNYSRQQLLEQLQKEDFDIVHIAAHSRIGRNFKESVLLTQHKATSFADLAEVIGSRRYASYPLELLTLSACQTTRGDPKAGLGLAGLLVNTGARSVLASLWKVDDQASAQLMQGFYRYWGVHQNENEKSYQNSHKKNHLSKAKALQKIQKDMLKSDHHHPFYWSGFILIGHWE